jgi:hypothetical protein
MGRWAAAAVVALAVVETGCHVEMAKVRDPRPIFDQARREAERVAGRPGGRASEVNVLVYDPQDQQLVRVQVPMWLAKKFDRKVQAGTRRIHLEDLAKTGAGTFVEVDEEGGEQVLVWLK